MKEKQTPLMRQYTQIKSKFPDTILFFRLGDFFETFNEDAAITSKVCGIALTKRNNGAAGDMPLAGFPHTQLDTYLPKLVKAGYRVAVCEQLEDPKLARGIVRRDVIEVVTPGVALYDKLLDNKKNNYVAALAIKPEKYGKKTAGLACADISTGEFFTSEFPLNELPEVLESLTPSEILISKGQKSELIHELDKLSFKPAVTKQEEWIFDNEFGREALLGHFKTQSLKGFGIEDLSVGIAASGAVLHYINETQNSQLSQLKSISYYNPSEFMILDYATRRNLEIAYSMSGGEQGTLISILDKTCTPMGGRLFKKWISRPLKNLNLIKRRLEVVKCLFDANEQREVLRSKLMEISDIERLISKICAGRANPRDVIFLKTSLEKIPEIKGILQSLNIPILQKFSEGLNPLQDVVDIINRALVDEPSVQLGTGNVFRPEYSDELNQFVEAKHTGKNWLNKYQEEERQKTGIQNLKIGYNNVFGYYIELSQAQKNKAPEYYDRKQTLTNAERFTTPELKEFERKILTAEEKISELEQALFIELLMKIAIRTEAIQDDAQRIASLDCMQSYAQTAFEYNYTEPEIDESDIIDIHEGRHPVVERVLPIGERFNANSTYLDLDNEQIHIITGPNMSGKSCYLRQVALIVLLGQIGSFVPAKKAHYGLVDRIFTRVGAQDNITAGESTFLVEMQEAANILNNASKKSLILLDEVGRGTATFDGISIAWSIAEYIHNNIGAKTLFATHYHELNDLEARYDHIVNYKVEVIETGGTVIFSHNVVKGGSDHSFGIHVAQMAGLPDEVIDRANIIMRSLEGKEEVNDDGITAKTPDISNIQTNLPSRHSDQLSIFEFRDDAIRDKVLQVDINNLTPLDALKILAELHKEAKKGAKR